MLLHRDFHERIGAADVPAAAAQDVQRFLNVIARASYVMPHMHQEPGKWEVFAHVSGDFNVLAFDAATPPVTPGGVGNVAETAHLSEEVPLVLVSPGTWHTVAALGDGGVMFEFKPGPYGGVAKDKVFAHQLDRPWAFDENDEKSGAAIAEYVRRLEIARGSDACDPLESAKKRKLTPFTRKHLLSMLKTGRPQRHIFSSGGPGEVKPVATILALPGSTVEGSGLATAFSEVAVPGSPWAVYVWLAAGSSHIAGQCVGPDNPVLEVWGDALATARENGIRVDQSEGSVLLELCASA